MGSVVAAAAVVAEAVLVEAAKVEQVVVLPKDYMGLSKRRTAVAVAVAAAAAGRSFVGGDSD
jgi:hypothetical protein